jgi:hypothetical protein
MQVYLARYLQTSVAVKMLTRELPGTPLRGEGGAEDRSLLNALQKVGWWLGAEEGGWGGRIACGILGVSELQ